MIPRATLRAVAVLIAVAAAMDPAWSTVRTPPTSATVVRMTRQDASAALRRLRNTLPGLSLDERTAAHGRIPCATGVPCILLADGGVGGTPASDVGATVSLVDLSAEGTPDVRIEAVAATASHASAVGTISVALARRRGSEIGRAHV